MRPYWDTSANRYKIAIIGICLGISVLLSVGRLHEISALPLDLYKRYQVELIAGHIVQSGNLFGISVPVDSSLYQRSVDLTHSPANPMIVAIMAQLTGTSVFTAQSIPVYAVTFLLAQAAIAYRIIRQWEVVVITPALSLLVAFPLLRIMSTADRHIMVWISFFVFVHLLIVTRGSTDPWKSMGVLVAMFGFIIADHTHPLSLTAFLVVMFLADGVFRPRKVPLGMYRLLIYGVAMIAFFSITFDWGGYVLGVLLQVLRNGVSISLSSPIPTSTLPEMLEPYSRPLSVAGYGKLYFYWSFLSRAIAGLICAVGGFVWLRRGLPRLRARQAIKIDIVMVALAVQATLNVVATFIFAKSDGTSPITLGLVMGPIIGGYAISTTDRTRLIARWQGPSSDSLVRGAVLIALAGAVVATPAVVHSMDGDSFSPLSESSGEQMQWLATYTDSGNEKVVSDFKTLSGFIAYGGRAPLYLPTSDYFVHPETVETFTDIYYTDPATAFEFARYYAVNEKMQRIGMMHLGGFATKPNPVLGQQLNESPRALKIYSNGDDTLYARRS